MVVREERRLWRKQNIHDRCRNCNANCSKTRTSVPVLLGRPVGRDGVLKKFGDVEGKLWRRKLSEGLECSRGLARA
jgi:hypothetical protein